MPREIRLYFEGDKSLKPGFDAFLQEIRARAGAARWKVSIIATGGNPERDFSIALRKHPEASNVLLRDSEGRYEPRLSGCLCEKHGWPMAQADAIFWMVQMMESWFHADKDALEKYYGKGFHKSALSANSNVEEIAKADLIEGLKAATKDTTKGKYHKTKHAPDLLRLVRPEVVRKAAPNCDKLFVEVLARVTAMT